MPAWSIKKSVSTIYGRSNQKPYPPSRRRGPSSQSQSQSQGCSAKRRNTMGQVVFQDPVHHISGKISKKYRTTYNYRKASERKYTSIRGERTTPITPAEQLIQGKFSTVRAAALARSRDLAHLTADQARWALARKAGDPHTTFNGWLFSKGWENYDEESGTVIWPDVL